MKHLKHIGIAASVSVMALAIHRYSEGNVLDALFWMSIASTVLMLSTSVKEEISRKEKRQ